MYFQALAVSTSMYLYLMSLGRLVPGRDHFLQVTTEAVIYCISSILPRLCLTQ